MADDDPCSPAAMRDEIRADARAERRLIPIALVAAAASVVVVVLRVLLS